MKHFVYSPKVEAYIYTSDAKPKMYDISDDIISGNVSRKVNAVSTATLKLASNGYKYDRKFKPMDRVSIYLTKTKRELVFTGYITGVPLYSVAGEVTIDCGCTLTRLQRLYWDDGLQDSINTYFDMGRGIGIQRGDSGTADGGMSTAITQVLKEVAEWSEKDIVITDIPKELAEYASSVYAMTNSEDEAFKDAMVRLFQAGNTGSASMNIRTDNIPEEYRSKIIEISNKYGFPAWFLAASCEAESNWNPKAISRGNHAYGLCQIEGTGSCAKRRTSKSYPYYIDGRGNYFDGNNWQDGNWSIEISGFLKKTSWEKAKKSSYWIDGDDVHNGKVAYHFYTRGPNTQVPYSDSDTRIKNFNRRISRYYTTEDVNIGSTDEQTWISVGDSPGAKAVVATALAEVGNSEDPSGSNRTKYGKAYGVDGVYWCAIFCWWVFNQAGMSEAFYGGKKTAWTVAIANYYKKKNQWFNKPKVGDLALFGRGSLNIGHVGIVVSVNSDGSFVTVEGNSGNKVKKINRKAGSAVGFGRPSYDEITPVNEDGTINVDTGDISLFNTNIWWRGQQRKDSAPNPVSMNLTGVRAYVNDTDVYSKIKSLCEAGLRSFSSGPSGEFWAWFPDKFGVAFDAQTTIDISNIEVTEVSSNFSDTQMCTHAYCYGSYVEDFVAFGGDDEKFKQTNGVATIDNEFRRATLRGAGESSALTYEGSGYSPSGDNDAPSDLLKMFLNIPKGKEKEFSPNEIYRRYGMRPKKLTPISNASNYSYIPYMMSLFALITSWQDMYSCSATTTFMPEVFPGMRVNFKDEDVQFYVDSVTHVFSYSSGFSTSMSLSCPTSKNRDYFIKDGGGVNAS